ncbi:MAG: hypothetical protein WC640_02950 [Candidatus Paceibacterota bacterium]|jgi:hypothetical protein
MDSKISTSFIPKSSINPGGLRSRREPISIVVLVSLLILAVSIIYFAGVYTYRYLVYNEVNAPCQDIGGGNKKCGLKESLDLAVRDLQLAKLADLKRLDTKLKNGAAVLNNHTTLKPFFDLLGQLTVQNIQYKKLQFSKGNKFDLEGVTKSYEDIAYQQKVFTDPNKGQKYISSFAFSGFDLDTKGNVNFKLTLTVDPKLLSYRENSQ